MNKKIVEWMTKIGEINELQLCVADVIETCIHDGKKPYYLSSLLEIIKNRTGDLYENMDDFMITQSCE